jgi:hypothetical protein
MDLEQVLKDKGVTSIEELEAKIKADALKEKEAQEALLRKQIKDLEEIKAKQGDSLGNAIKELDEAKAKLLEIEKGKIVDTDLVNKTKDAPSAPQGKTEEQWRLENEAREKALGDAEWAKLDEAYKSAPDETRKLASTEEGRAAFMAAVLGSALPKAQETFRRPAQEKKLTVEEQIKIGLGLIKPNTVPNVRASGSGFADRQDSNTRQQIDMALTRTGSLRDLIKAHKPKE